MTVDPPSRDGSSGSASDSTAPSVDATSIPNVLAERYASAEMKAIWSTERKVVLERELWLAVLRAQRDAGVFVPEGAIEAYEANVHSVDLASITARERVTRHDVKARIEEFCALAGYEHIHRAMTSRDLTENVEQAQLREALQLVRDRLVAALARTAHLARKHAHHVMVGRTHNVPAQVTTLGKRWATIGEEVLAAHERLDGLLARYALRGLKGSVGTQQDMLELLGSTEAVEQVEQRLAEHLGFGKVMNSVGQVYPRSFDAEAVSALVSAVAPLSNMATAIRLMAGHDLVTEGFSEGQVGSSAMPHKMNPRSSERINGLMVVLRGYLTMAAGLAGDQWNEGDVSCSVVRRVVLPDACFAADGAIETALEVLDGFAHFHVMVDNEFARYLPLLGSSRLLNLAVKAGNGREEAHAIINESLTGFISQMRAWGEESDPDKPSSAHSSAFYDRAASALYHRLQSHLGISEADLADWRYALESGAVIGLALEQVHRFEAAASLITDAHPDLATYTPAPIL